MNYYLNKNKEGDFIFIQVLYWSLFPKAWIWRRFLNIVSENFENHNRWIYNQYNKLFPITLFTVLEKLFVKNTYRWQLLYLVT